MTRLIPLLLLTTLPLALTGCTINTYPDGSRETRLGVPMEDGSEAGTIRDETGDTRLQTDVPD